ncbi:MAG: ribosome-associated translation inhibitor RaiA [Candidatus Aureabacteria bacterium]|nr:ribosome-associated translation inhibitor RaiA [Candidatus Auribacterota bacterium]
MKSEKKAAITRAGNSIQPTVTGRHVDVTNSMKEYAREKLGRVMRERPHLNEVHVIMDVEKYRHRLEVAARGKNLDLFCKEETDDMYTSIDRAVAKLERQLLKFKERHLRKTTKAHAAPHAPPPGGETAEPVIALRFPMKPMFLNEALLQMKAGSHLFFIFLNADSEQVNFLFQGREGAISLLIPKKIRGMDKDATFSVRVLSEESVSPDARPKLLEKGLHAAPWESPEDALAAMVAAGGKFRFFMNTEAENASVVYQQIGGDYALIEPMR